MSESKAASSSEGSGTLLKLSDIHARCLRDLESSPGASGGGGGGSVGGGDDGPIVAPKDVIKRTTKAIKAVMMKRFEKLKSPPEDHEEVFMAGGLKYSLSKKPDAFAPITDKWVRDRLAQCLLVAEGTPKEYKTDEDVTALCDLLFDQESRPLKKPSFKFKVDGEDLVKLGIREGESDDDGETDGDDAGPRKRRRIN